MMSKKYNTYEYSKQLIKEYIPEVYKLKRPIDIGISIFALIILFPLLLLIATLIKLSSKGPIIFKQIRIGKDGNEFTFYKFRSMKLSNESDDERKKQMINFIKTTREIATNGKIVNNNRVTWIGKIIRKTALDELPQLYNVLKGDMSLVGPRPCLPYEYENYNDWQKNRLNTIPGCTCLWQVKRGNNSNFNRNVKMDLYYIENMSLWLDMKLILMTIPAMIISKGSK